MTRRQWVADAIHDFIGNDACITFTIEHQDTYAPKWWQFWREPVQSTHITDEPSEGIQVHVLASDGKVKFSDPRIPPNLLSEKCVGYRLWHAVSGDLLAEFSLPPKHYYNLLTFKDVGIEVGTSW
jgi:hypothetical protein